MTQQPPKMTRAHYEYLAQFATVAHDAILRTRVYIYRPTPTDFTMSVMQALCHHMKGTNPSFNPDKFMSRVEDHLSKRS